MYNLLTIDTLAFAKLPLKVATQFFTAVFLKDPLGVFSQMDGAKCPVLKIQEVGSVADFILITPLAHAELADNQNTATMMVKQKS